jgi:uncharacterized protein (DUF2267 family)
MHHDEFVGQLQHRVHLASRGEAEAAIRATLETLADRILQATAHHLADQLPPEIGEALRHGIMERFGVDDFIERIAAREKVTVSTAAFHARLVLSLITEVVSYGIMLKVRRELPEEFGTLFLSERGAGTEHRHAPPA